MRALHKDIFREIIKTKSKFISIIIIMFLGSFVFVGLEETPPTMLKTTNEYFKKINIYDLKITNKFNLTKDDVALIKAEKDIKNSETYYKKVVKNKEKSYSLDLISLPENIGTPLLIAGKLPEKDDEIVLTESLINEYNIGDFYKIKDSDNEDIKIVKTNFKIVGFVYSVDYPDNSTNNKNNTNYFGYVKKENFQSDVFSGINLTLKNIARENFSKSYYNSVNDVRDKILGKLDKEQEKNNINFQETNEKNFQESKNKLEEYKENLKQSEEILTTQKDIIPSEIYEKNKDEIEKNKNELIEKEQSLIKAKERIEKINYPRYSVENIQGNFQYKQFINSSYSLKKVSNIFSVFLFAVAILVTLTTITRMIDENRINIGTLKSLGYNNFQIAKKYIFYGVLSAMIGSLLGIVSAYKIIVPIIYNSYARFLILKNPIINISLEIILLALLITIISVLLAIYVPLRKILKEKSASLLRPKVPKAGSRIFLEYVPFIWKNLSFLNKVTFRNIFRYKVRMIMTIFGIFGCLALMFVGFGIRYSIVNLTKEQFEVINKFDLIATYNPYLTDKEKEDLDKVIKTNNNIKETFDLNMNHGTIEKNNEILDNVSILALDQKNDVNNYFSLKSTSGENLALSDDGVLINEKLSYLHNLKKGSNLEIIINDKKYTVKVSGIYKNYLGHNIYMNKNYFEKMTNSNFENNSYLIKVNDEKKVHALIENLENKKDIVNIQNMLSLKKILENFLSGIDIIVVVIVLCSVTLAFVVLYNLININVSERIRELSTIKVLGFYTKETTAYIFREIIYLGVVGIVLGNILGYKLYKKIIIELAAREMMFETNVNINVYFLASFITLIIILIVMAIMYNRLKKINMVEALKSVE